jgi:hypothetical protein
MKNKYKIKKGKKIKKLMLFKFAPFFITLFIFLSARILPAQDSLSLNAYRFDQAIKNQPYFYNVDKETTIEGQIEDFKFESRYEGKGYFLILMVKDKASGQLIEVETAPVSFFNIDIYKGEKIQLVGSLTEDKKQGKKLVLARELKINNQTIVLRDRHGFPAWSSSQGRKRSPGS